MSCYAIGVGGSGARVIESLVHLCAAGLGPDELKLIFVDLDLGNGNLERVQQLVRAYEALQQSGTRSLDTGWLRTRVSLMTPAVWSPFAAYGGAPKLETFFQAVELRARRPGAGLLLDYMYEPRQMRLDLTGGFRAMPSIGAAAFAAKLDPREEEPWRVMVEDISKRAGGGQMTRVFICGSIFGGTGASGLPTLARLIKNGVTDNPGRLAQAGALLLPYFGFGAPRAAAGEAADTPYARSEDFLLQSHAGLEYYSKYQGDLGYDRLYVIGESHPADYRTEPYGKGQANEPHFVELLAGAAALDFFHDTEPTRKDRKVAKVGRADLRQFGWADVPHPQALSADRPLQQAIGRYARMSLAYAASIGPALDAAAGVRTSRRPAWIRSLVDRVDVDITAEPVKATLSFQGAVSRACLEWLRGLQGAGGSPSPAVTRLIFRADALPAWPDVSAVRWDAFDTLVLESPSDSRTLGTVWRRLAAARLRQFAGARHLGVFQSALFAACQ